MGGGGDALPDEGKDSAMQAGFEAEVHREPATDEAMDFFQVFTSGKRCRRLLKDRAEDEYLIAFLGERYAAMAGHVVENAEHADHGRWVDPPVARLVVEADVARDDRRSKL